MLGRSLQILNLVQFVVKRFKADAELFGGFWFVAAITFQTLINRLHFQIAERDRSVGFNCGGVDFQSPRAEMIWQMFGADRQFVAENRCVFNDIGQLAHVTGPFVLSQSARALRE